MKRVHMVIVLLFISLRVFATAQVGDILIWKGDTLVLFSNPLELRDDYDLIIGQISEEIDRKIKTIYPEETDGVSTACWRGYRAEWIVLNDSIFLSNIYSCYYDNVKVNLNNIFPNNIKFQKLFASWISGDLYLPQGEIIQYVHLGYLSIFERETVLTVENGILKNNELFHNRIAKRTDFFERVHLFDFIHERINWEYLPDLTNRSIQVYIGVQPNEQGQFESIDEEYTYLMEYPVNDSISKLDIVTDTNNIFIKEGIRIAKLIPEWNVIWQRGKIVGMGIMIDFSERTKKKYVR